MKGSAVFYILVPTVHAVEYILQSLRIYKQVECKLHIFQDKQLQQQDDILILEINFPVGLKKTFASILTDCHYVEATPILDDFTKPEVFWQTKNI